MNKTFHTHLSKLILLLTATTIHHASAATSSLLVNTYPYYHELPKQVADVCYQNNNCPEIDISYIHSSQAWVDKIINQYVNDIIITDVDYQPVTLDEHTLPAPRTIQKSLDEFAITQIEDKNSMPYSMSVNPTYLGHAGSLEFFEIAGYDYWGGAHGVGFVLYFILDNDLKKEINLEDILISGQKPALRTLVEAEFDKWIIEQDMTPSEYKQTWSFKLTDNVMFTNSGLKFLYQPYDIAAYANGMPEFTITYDDLEGIVQEKYLQIGKQIKD